MILELHAVGKRFSDMVVIPAGVPHWFSAIDGSITYVVMRVDPGRLLAAK